MNFRRYAIHLAKKENLQKLIYYLKTEDLDMVFNRVLTYLAKMKSVDTAEIKPIEETPMDSQLCFPSFEKPAVSIVIPVHNQWQYTHRCLYSIYKNTSEISYEVIIADDASSDQTILIHQCIENVKVIRNETNQGFLKNCNTAAQHARGKYIHFLNNDTYVQPGWLTSLFSLLERDADIGIAGSKLLYEDGRLQEAGGIIWSDGSGWNYGRLSDPEHPEYNYVKEVDYISGASIMIRASLWREIGGFDERYAPAYYEDTDLALEVRKRGYRVVYQPQSVVIHFEGISHGKNASEGIKRYQERNREKFTKKWKLILKKQQFPNGQHVFYARNRSRDKQTILVIDHYVPHYDRDAGGRCTYQYLKLFRDLGLHVIFLGDNYFKHEPYTSQLQQLGIEVLYGDWYIENFNKWLEVNGQYLDYVYLNRPHIAIKYIHKIKKMTKGTVMYFGHDLHYLRELRRYEIEKNEEVLRSSNRWKTMEFTLFEAADIVHVVGSYEQRLIQEQFCGKKVRNIPLYIFKKSNSIAAVDFSNKRDLLFVGGFNHQPNLDAVLWFTKEVFPIITAAIPELKVYIVGSNPPKVIQELGSDRIIVTGFVSDEELKQYYAQCRLTVVPLRYGAGVKGKVVEALHYGVPVITTSIGLEGLDATENILLKADHAEEFARTVIEAYDDIGKLQEISIRGRQYIQDNFSAEKAMEVIKKDVIGCSFSNEDDNTLMSKTEPKIKALYHTVKYNKRVTGGIL